MSLVPAYVQPLGHTEGVLPRWNYFLWEGTSIATTVLTSTSRRHSAAHVIWPQFQQKKLTPSGHIPSLPEPRCWFFPVLLLSNTSSYVDVWMCFEVVWNV